MPEPDAIQEQAALYVLGQLGPRERAEFEMRLAASPALRATVQEIEEACEGLALSASPRRPPKRAWDRIVRATRSGAIPADSAVRRIPSLPWREYLAWVGWGVAAVVLAVWTFSDGSPRFRPPTRLAGLTSNPAEANDGRPGDGSGGSGSGQPGSTTRSRVSPATVNPSNRLMPSRPAASRSSTGRSSIQPVEGLSRDEALRLQARVRQLANELADVQVALAQRDVIPVGTLPLQVFRLVSTNFPGPERTGDPGAFHEPGDSSPLPTLGGLSIKEILAQAIAQELAGVSDGPSTGGLIGDFGSHPTDPPTPPTTPTPPTPTTALPPATGDELPSRAVNRSPTDSFAVIDLMPEVSFDSGVQPAPGAGSEAIGDAASPDTALGYYSTDTGRGALAVWLDQPLPAGHTYQVWAIDGTTGASVSLGTTSSTASQLLIRFTLEPGAIRQPGFLVTLEPGGGSPAPTGPVVFRPPTQDPVP